jgi:hypothetical protein
MNPELIGELATLRVAPDDQARLVRIRLALVDGDRTAIGELATLRVDPDDREKLHRIRQALSQLP